MIAIVLKSIACWLKPYHNWNGTMGKTNFATNTFKSDLQLYHIEQQQPKGVYL